MSDCLTRAPRPGGQPPSWRSLWVRRQSETATALSTARDVRESQLRPRQTSVSPFVLDVGALHKLEKVVKGPEIVTQITLMWTVKP